MGAPRWRRCGPDLKDGARHRWLLRTERRPPSRGARCEVRDGGSAGGEWVGLHMDPSQTRTRQARSCLRGLRLLFPHRGRGGGGMTIYLRHYGFEGPPQICGGSGSSPASESGGRVCIGRFGVRLGERSPLPCAHGRRSDLIFTWGLMYFLLKRYHRIFHFPSTYMLNEHTLKIFFYRGWLSVVSPRPLNPAC